MKKVRVNENCIGCGACTAIAEEVFDFNDDMQAYADDQNNNFDAMKDELKEKVMDALEGCPVGAIELVEGKDCDCHSCHCSDDCECDEDCDCDSECHCDNCHCHDDEEFEDDEEEDFE